MYLSLKDIFVNICKALLCYGIKDLIIIKKKPRLSPFHFFVIEIVNKQLLLLLYFQRSKGDGSATQAE